MYGVNEAQIAIQTLAQIRADEARRLLRPASYVCPNCRWDVRGYDAPKRFDEDGRLVCPACEG